jgi:hypothetical protein
MYGRSAGFRGGLVTCNISWALLNTAAKKNPRQDTGRSIRHTDDPWVGIAWVLLAWIVAVLETASLETHAQAERERTCNGQEHDLPLVR